jgi:predicted ribonuclease toxin of YeeF-YezG toxin-antitoxin module
MAKRADIHTFKEVKLDTGYKPWPAQKMTKSEAEKIFFSDDLNKKYNRPTSFRAGVRDQVWENAKDSHGRVRDPVTGKYMSKDKPWDMGHKPGYEFKKHQESAAKRNIPHEQWVKECNDPEKYRPELPSSNRSHRGEDKTNNYFGY